MTDQTREDLAHGVLSILEDIRGELRVVNDLAAEVEDLDELARIRLLLTDNIVKDVSGIVATVDLCIVEQVPIRTEREVLDGRKIVTVTSSPSGGSTHWNHLATLREVLRYAIADSGGDIEQMARTVATCLGKSAAWKVTELTKLSIAANSLRETTAKDWRTVVAITDRPILPQTPPPESEAP